MIPIDATWTGNSSYTTTITQSFAVYRVSISYDATITNNATIVVDRAPGANYDELPVTFNNSAGKTKNSATFGEKELRLGTGDKLVVACDTGANNAYLTIDYEII